LPIVQSKDISTCEATDGSRGNPWLAFSRGGRAKLRPCSRFVDAVSVGDAVDAAAGSVELADFAAAGVVAADLSDCDHEPFP
jgi:hypothetical protein